MSTAGKKSLEGVSHHTCFREEGAKALVGVRSFTLLCQISIGL